MRTIEAYVLGIFNYFYNDWIAAAILALVVIVLAIKKPKLLFRIVCLIVGGLALLYVLIYMEGALFSGHSSTEKAYDVERKIR